MLSRTFAPRALPRAGARAPSQLLQKAPRRRYADSASSASSNTTGGLSHGVTGGLVGGGLVFFTLYGYYYFSGARTAVQTASQAKSYVDSTAAQLKQQLSYATPDSADELTQQIKETAHKYAAWIPGGRQFVDQSFKDLETIKQQHGDEVNEILRNTYDELKQVANKKGTSLDAVSDIWSVLSKRLSELGALATDAAQDLLDNHPELKNKFGDSFGQLQELGNKFGPEAKKQADETISEVKKIAQQGLTFSSADQIRRLVQDKVEQLKKLGDQSWDGAWDQLKPMLDKSPKVKEWVDKNKDKLLSGNVSDAVNKVKEATQSGETGSLDEYAKNISSKAQEAFSSSSVGKYLSLLPSGGEIVPQLQKLASLLEQKGPEAEKLTKETLEELKEVLRKKSQEAEKLVKDVKNQAK